jgi:dTDP-4-dehydrorhamnose reductase
MTTRVLVTGATGLLGGWLTATAPAETSVVPVGGPRSPGGVDLRDRASTRAVVAAVRPDVVLHAAYAKDEASILDATAHVVDSAGEAGAEVVFTSTDCVFSGDGRRRAEIDAPDPRSAYGRWKAAAEAIVGAAGGAIVRLPLLVSTTPEDHVIAQIRAGAATGTPTPWYDDEWRRPALAAEVASALWSLVALAAADRAGAWHLAGPEHLTRWHTARRVVEHLGLAPSTVRSATTPPGSDRPRDLDLADDRARAALGWDPSPIPG